MKIYAVRDRLIDYFLKPFIADSDKQVLASAAAAINLEDNRDPIAQTPSHFEIWRLGEIDENTGNVKATPELLADASSLLRPGLREGRERGEQTVALTESQRGGPSLRPGLDGNAHERAPAGATQAEARPGEKTHPGPH